MSLRYRLHEDPEHPFSEAIGVVMSVDESNIQVMNKRGETVSIPIVDIEASKLFPV